MGSKPCKIQKTFTESGCLGTVFWKDVICSYVTGVYENLREQKILILTLPTVTKQGKKT